MIVQLSPFNMQQKHPGIVHRIKQAYNVGGCSAQKEKRRMVWEQWQQDSVMERYISC